MITHATEAIRLSNAEVTELTIEILHVANDTDAHIENDGEANACNSCHECNDLEESSPADSASSTSGAIGPIAPVTYNFMVRHLVRYHH